MRPRQAIQVLLAAFALAAPMVIAGNAGAAWAQVVLPAPEVTSADYPDDGTWHDGLGEYGDFTFADPSGQAVRYEVSVNGERQYDLPTQDGAPVTVPIAPQRSGPNILYVQSFGPAGENSPGTTYEFRVNAGTAPKAHWKLDEPAGAGRLAAETREGEDPVTARVVGQVATGASGRLGTAARFTGGFAFARPQVDTSESFTMTAWAKPSRDGDSVVIAATGSRRNAFALQSLGGHWAFVKSASDSLDAATAQAAAEQPVHPGVWNHLAGVYDATLDRLRLYVNGTLASDADAGDPAWNAEGSLRIGTGARPRTHEFHGDLDEVGVYDRMIVPGEAAELPRVPKWVHGRWKYNTDGADDSAFGNDMTLRGGAAIDPGAGFRGWASPAGLLLDGAGAYAETAGPVFRSDDSFTVSTWVNTEQRPAGAATLLSLPGENANRFAVRSQPGTEPGFGWQLVMADADDPGARTTVAEHTGSTRSWDHVAVVYDGPARTMSLYVNGQVEAAGSVKHDVGAFDARGALQVGRSAIGAPEYWQGAVDDVWAFQGALSQAQVAMLGSGVELETMESLD
ncbi:LamG domain-containing protein [Actinomadura sp. 7K507]|uniref:LamG domain-containing protein n=1 Tax=Actinomadura sp. 7K507 TaxID=2530365 RepID=UPI0014054E71|nr:LamG domain-containing protein [Actinomadura sp. 7K507]